MNIKTLSFVFIGMLSSMNSGALPVGDTVGKVSAVRTNNNNGKSYNSFQIWLTDVKSDRWSCIKTQGYIEVRDNTASVTNDSLRMMFSIALAAQASGKYLSLDSGGIEPCVNGTNAWMHDQ